ncbi:MULTISPECIES: DUF3038 domain-containing protein [Cyanophyceae]|uniref:DUF3038 domain-containing protein n=2 Tax=Cyanophyceae TaxID=3028117 RepID=A0A1U7J585_9CYAN|nr:MULTISPECIES: DUF3038 domain-containing protein [Cyanophyceae]MBD2107880.1 DUF3038 domain-containing protein [Nodosilinea sp. FACHB-13]MBD2114574.1 DUF3038 domain-containing protein [Nodosilinea sp. FACHB-141]MBD2232678.1 DUF3038 domain-containing protein [Phormidium tenue FACHB-1052]OKH47803.1 hypothetical protein NIES30_12570 [Phormidium tenue NIES-30]
MEPSSLSASNSEPNPVQPQGPPTPRQLSSIKAQLDLVLLALEALTGLGSDAMLAAANDLGVSDLLSDRVNLWRLRQASPLRKGQGRKKLDVDEARALVLVSCHLAIAHRDPIRQAVARLEKALEQGQPPHRTAQLGDYLDAFSNAYQDRMEGDQTATTDEINALGLKLLVDLLFYSGSGGSRKLWVALLERAGQ